MDRTPRVSCGGCSFRWFSATSSHGLRIVGSCPRCGGDLEFLVAASQDADDAAQRDRELDHDVAPATVLGVPLGWDR
jgi:hypothetical protein